MLALLVPVVDAVKNDIVPGRRAGKLGFAALMLLLTAVLALRGRVGTDTTTMVTIYMNVQNTHGSAKAGIYYIYSYCLYFFFPFPQAILISNAIITMTCLLHFIRVFSDDKFLSLYLYITLSYYTYSFNIMRQMLAAAIMLSAIACIYLGKNKRGIVYAIIACGMHITAAALFPMLLVFHWKKVNTVLLAACVCVSLFVLAFKDAFIALLVQILRRVLPAYGQYFADGTLSFDGYVSQGRIVWLYVFFVAVILALCFLATISKNNSLNEMARLFIVPSSIGTAIGFMGVTNPLFSRLALYYTVFMTILLPQALQYFKASSRIVAKVAIIIITFAPYYVTLASNHSHVIPYRLIWK